MAEDAFTAGVVVGCILLLLGGIIGGVSCLSQAEREDNEARMGRCVRAGHTAEECMLLYNPPDAYGMPGKEQR